jgi:hypothetical protein
MFLQAHWPSALPVCIHPSRGQPGPDIWIWCTEHCQASCLGIRNVFFFPLSCFAESRHRCTGGRGAGVCGTRAGVLGRDSCCWGGHVLGVLRPAGTRGAACTGTATTIAIVMRGLYSELFVAGRFKGLVCEQGDDFALNFFPTYILLF